MSTEVETKPVEDIKQNTEESNEAPIEAAKLLSQGKRNLLCGEIPTAVNELQESCGLLAATFGETAKECGESYFYYGQALLELARMETGILGNALQGVPEDDTEDDEQDDQFGKADQVTGKQLESIREEVLEAMSEPDEPKEEVNGYKADKKEEEMETEENKQNAKESPVKESVGKEAVENGTEEIKNENAPVTDKNEENASEKPSNGEVGSSDKEVLKESQAENEGSVDAEPQSKNNPAEEDKNDGRADSKEGENMEVTSESNEQEDQTNEDDEAENEEEGTSGGEEQISTEEAETDPGEGTSKDDKEDPDEISNFQLAWEMLELAKVIFLRQDGKEMQLKAAQAFLKLGDISLETEQYEQAISDLSECFKIQKELLEEDDRLLAETQYQLAVALNFNRKFDESVDCFRGAIKVIENRISKLEKVVEDGKTEQNEKKPEDEAEEKTEGDKTGPEKIDGKTQEEAKDDKKELEDPVKAAEREILDLKEILPDIRTKIEDVLEDKQSIDVVKEMAKDAVTSQMVAKDDVSSQVMAKDDVASQMMAKDDVASQMNDGGAKPTDITHLLRKKRKPESDAEEEVEAKKCRQEDGSGDAKVVSNGVNGTDKAEASNDVEEKDVSMATEDKAEAVST